MTDWKNFESIFQALTDFEIDCEKDCARVHIEGVARVRIRMLPEYYALQLREFFTSTFNDYVKMLQMSIGDRMEAAQREEYITGKVQYVLNLFGRDLDEKQVQSLHREMSDFFFYRMLRKAFFKLLKQMRLIPFWVTFSRYERKATLVDTVTLFVLLYLFNEYGVKKKLLLLMQTVNNYINTNTHTRTMSNDSEKWGALDAKMKEHFSTRLNTKADLNENSSEQSI